MRKMFVAIASIVFASLLIFGCSEQPSRQSADPDDMESPEQSIVESSQTEPEALPSDDGMPHATADTVFGYPRLKEVKSGSGDDIGTVAVFSASSDECTPENLEKWCNQYVRWGMDNWCVVSYSDSPGYGVYASGAILEKDVKLASDYSLDDDSEAVFYVFSANDPTELGTLSPWE